jgi:hypothetical protein
LFKTPRVYGTITVTGAGSVTYTDPDDPNNPWNGTFDLNGTYTRFYDHWWGKPGGRLFIDFTWGEAAVSLTLVSTADVNNWYGGVMPTPNPNGEFDANYSYERLWYIPPGNYAGYDFQNSCGTNTLSSSNYTIYDSTPYTGTGSPTYPGLVVNGSAPTLTWNPDNTNRTICNNGGGIYVGMYFSTYNGPYDATEEECVMISQLVDGGDPSIAVFGYWGGSATGAGCSAAASPGGNYYFDSQGFLAGPGSMGGGCCSDESTCLAPFQDCITDWSTTIPSCP